MTFFNGWFFDLLRDLAHSLLYEHRSTLILILSLAILYLFKSKIKDIQEAMKQRFKDNSWNIFLGAISFILLVTLDDPIPFLGKLKQFFLGLLFFILTFFKYLKAGVVSFNEQKIKNFNN